MFRCLVAYGTESTRGARAQEAPRLIGQFIGDETAAMPGRPRPVEELR